MTEPVPVIALEYQQPSKADARGRFWRPVNRVALATGASVALVGWLTLLSDVHAVLVAGPALFTTGAVMVVGGLLRRQPWVWGIGLAHCAVCLLFVALVNVLNWGPQQAAEPFRAMAGAYNLLSLPATAWAFVRRAG